MSPVLVYTPDILPPLLTAPVCALLLVYAWPRRHVPGGPAFLAGLLLMTLASLAQAFLISAVLLDLKIVLKAVWTSLLFLAVVALIAQSLHYGGMMQRIPRRVALGSLALVALFAALALTNPAHHLFWRSIWFDDDLHSAFGPAGYLAVLYIYLLSSASIGVTIVVATRAHGRLRYQAVLVALAMFIILGGYTVDVARNNDLIHVPFSTAAWPAIVTVLGLSTLTLALFKLQAFDLTPVARHLVIEHMNEGMLVVDGKGRVVDTNPGAGLLLGIDRSGIIGKDVRTVLNAWPEVLAAFTATGAAAPRQRARIERGLGGRTIDLDISPLLDDGQGSGRLIMCRDVTEIRRAEATVERQRLALATLTERERLGRELHDGLAQVLAYAKMQVAATSDGLKHTSVEQSQAELTRVGAVLQEGHDELRHFLLGIKPGQAAGAGDAPPDLCASVSDLAGRFSAHHGFRVQILGLSDMQTPGLDPETHVQLMRILQESLVNIQRHAGVGVADMVFREDNGFLHVSVSDQGTGFDAARFEPFALPDGSMNHSEGCPSAEGHYGLRFMRDRVEAVGGSLEIISQAGSGTEVRVRVPLSTQLAPARG